MCDALYEGTVEALVQLRERRRHVFVIGFRPT
jgi:hypothetical protein